MAELFAGGHLRFLEGEWRNDDGDVVDVAEVVRCKNCENYSGKYCRLTDDTEDHREPDDYCSYGKPKERGSDNG